MNFGIGSFAYRWSIGRPYYRPEDPMTVDQLIDRCVKYGVKAVLLCNNISLHEFTEEQLTAIRDLPSADGQSHAGQGIPNQLVTEQQRAGG